jgi:predicted dehydrogenase
MNREQLEHAIRAAVIGCGPIGTLHARAIRTSPHATLAGVCDVDPARAGACAELTGARSFSSAAELLHAARPDVVTVATPDHLHVDVALAALDAGCHVFCEKPLATTLADARRLVDAAAARGVQLGVNYNRRFGFAYRKARELIEAGRAGELRHLAIHVTDHTPRPGQASFPEAILTRLLTHHLDLARWLGGEVATASAAFGPPAPDGLLRDVVITLRFAAGAVGSIVSGFRDEQARTREECVFFGSRGTIVVEDVTRRASLWEKDPGCREVFEPNGFAGPTDFHATLAAHLQAFLASLSRGEPIPVTGQDGLRGLELVEMMAPAARSVPLGATRHT